MMGKIFSKLTARVLAFIASLHLFFILFLYYGLGPVIKDSYQSQFVDYVRADAFNFAANISGGSPLTVNINTLALENAVLSGTMVYVHVFSNDNDPIASFGDFNNKKFTEDFYFGRGDDEIYHIAAPVHNMLGNKIGNLQIGYDETDAQKQISLVYQRASIFSFIYLTIALIVSVFFGRRMTLPIETLQELTKKIAHGQYQTKISVNTGVSEISSLSEMLEFMREELVSQSNSMKHLALHDNLTSLPNRVLLEDRVNQVILCRLQGQEPCVLVVLDLDRFKEINDSFGHLMGDNILKQVAIRITRVLRKSDTVARLGGDEFALFFPNTMEALAINMAKKVILALTDPFECEGHTISIGASMGVAAYPENGGSYKELLQRADIAMYAAKRMGGGVQSYASHLNKDSLAHLTLVSDLRVAIEKDQFFIVYQPKINISSGSFSGVEALVRWKHPIKGIIPPVEFIPIAERCGLISKITSIVLNKAITQSSLWRNSGMSVPVAINLSPLDLVGEGLQELIFGLLKNLNFPANLLELEITESGFFTDPLRANEILEGLSVAGVKIAIDDFGTGYSSLSQLRKMPVSTLKIDRSFVFDMTDNSNDAAIVGATISMAHQMGLKVIAEGVEDNATLKALKELNCDIAQGYLFAKPMLGSELETWLKNKETASTE